MIITITIITIITSTYTFLTSKDKSLLHAPAEMINGKKNGLWSVLFLDATIVNVFATSFASLMAAVSAKRNQKPVQDNIHHAWAYYCEAYYFPVQIFDAVSELFFLEKIAIIVDFIFSAFFLKMSAIIFCSFHLII